MSETSGPALPPAANAGDVWFNTATGLKFLYVVPPGAWVQQVQGHDPTPRDPKEGDIWFDADGLRFSYTVSSSGVGAWAELPAAVGTPTSFPSPHAGAPPVNALVASGPYPPATPNRNDLWYDSITGFFFIWYDDSNTIQWVVCNPGQGREEGPPGQTGDIGPPGINWLGEWSIVTPYLERDAVEHLGSSYYALVDSLGMAPDVSPTYWSLLAAKGDQGEAGEGITITEGPGIDVTGGPDYTIAIDPLATFPPSAHTHAQAAITNLISDLALKAPLASPTFTGDPKAPTPATADNDTSIATTAWGRLAIATYAPTPDLTPYELKVNKGAASGYCPLDATTKVAAAYLPAYVDDVLEFANLAAFPGTGSTGVIYVALDTGKIYRWSGSIYVEISPSPGSTDAVPEGSTNLYFTNERVDDRVDALIVDGTNITTTYNDAAGTLTIAAAAYPTSLPPSGAAGGALTGTYPNPTLVGGPLSNYALTSSIPTTLPPSGAASGDLAGTYPSPTIKANVNLSGIPTAATAAPATNTTQLATTAFVTAAVTASPAGTVTSASVVSANGLAGTVATPTTTPAITLSTTITGMLKGNGTAISAGVAGTDYVIPAGLPTSLPPSGTASGDLTGTYPSPTIKASVNLSGVPTAATAAPATNTTQLATTAFVTAALAGGGASISVGTTPPGSPGANALWWYSDAVTGGGTLMIYYNDGNTSQWVPAAASTAIQTTPSGAIMDYAGAAAPAGWLLCQGQLVSRTTYPNLFAAIGVLYGAGDGSTTFAVPDLGGRVTAGKETTATRLSFGATLGGTGGAQTVALTAAENAAHSHTGVADPTHYHSSDIGAGTTWVSINSGQAFWTNLAGGTIPVYYTGLTANGYTGMGNGGTSSSGSGSAHQNTQPTIIMNKIIKT